MICQLFFVFILNNALESGKFPNDLNITEVIALQKKNNKRILKISTNNQCFQKFFKKVVYIQLLIFLMNIIFLMKNGKQY